MKPLLPFALIAVALTFAAAGCAKAEWQENHGNGDVTQQSTPPPQEKAPPLPGHRPPQAFDDCRSQTLSVEVDTSKSQDDLQDFWTTAKRYPLIKVTQAAKTKKKTTFFITATDSNQHACDDKACAEDAGWSQFQNDILDLNGNVIQCYGQPAPPPDATPVPVTEPGSGNGRG